jgi:hypothetical protein
MTTTMRYALLATVVLAAGIAAVPLAPHAAAPRVDAAAAALDGAPEPVPDPAAWRLVPHVRAQAYYGLNDVNRDVPPAYMAAHVDIVEDDGYTAPHADAFKRAGGALAIAYTDPTYGAHCPPPFTPPAGRCEGQIAKLVAADERAWIHDASGARIHRFNDPYYQYQEVFNITWPAVRRAYARTTAEILAASPRLDGFEADDSGSPFTGRDGVPGSNLYGEYSGHGVEIRSDEEYFTAASAMLAAAGKPVIVNGGDPVTWGPAYGGRFLRLPFVMGQQFEGCFNNAGKYRYTEIDDKFRREENGLLAVVANRKLAVCFPTGDTTPPHRRYAYAAWLLTYDPRYSAYEMNVPQSDGIALYPEIELVPLQPRRTPRSIDDLRVGAVYAREFGACAIAARTIGPCAAVVNASSRETAPVPSLSIVYGHRIELDPQSLYHGGKARVVEGAPQQLAPESAAILVR